MSNQRSDKHDSGGPCETPLDDLERSALAHYEELSNKACHWLSTIPMAIRFYFDAKRKAAAPVPECGRSFDLEAVSWAYHKLLAFGMDGNINAAMMLDRMKAMLTEEPK